jgi:hypothetical protein
MRWAVERNARTVMRCSNDLAGRSRNVAQQAIWRLVAWPAKIQPARRCSRLGGAVAASPSSNPGLVALRDALLRHLDELERPFRSTALVVARLQRFKLGWLGGLVVLPRLTADAFSTANRSWRGEAPASAQAATRRLVELTGKDPASAGGDVAWMVDQLRLLSARAADWPLPEPHPSHRLITRAELELAAEALIGLVRNDRYTDDRLLAATQESYAVLARLQRERAERFVERSSPRMRSLPRTLRLAKADQPPIAEAGRRCREAWIGWLDQQAATRPP